MAGTNIDNLNFKVILDDKDFNDRIQKDIKAAKDLNVQLSQLLQAKVKINTITAQEAASAKRASDILAKQAIDQEKIRKQAALTAEAEEKVRTQAEKTANEVKKGATEMAKAAKEQQRTATEAQKTAKENANAATAAQRFRTETQRTATEAQRTATATQNAAAATARAQLAQRRLRDYAKQTTTHVQTQSRIMSELKGIALSYLSIRGATQLLTSLVRITGEFELQKTALSSMLGDLDKAERLVSQIQQLAVKSPFQFKELTAYSKQLAAFSVPAQELYDTTKMLADVSAGLGVGMDRIVLAYGQIRSAAFLRGQEVRQLTEAGIPILKLLADQFSEIENRAVSAGEVFDRISARLVPFEMVAKVFKDMTSEGGKFYNMQEIQAETLRGKVMNLKDAYEIMLTEIGNANSGTLNNWVDGLRSLIKNWEKVGVVLKSLLVTFGAYKAAVALVTLYQKGLVAVELTKKFIRMAKATNVAAGAMRAFGLSVKTLSGGALGAILGITTAIIAGIKAANKWKKEIDSIFATEAGRSNNLVENLNEIVKKLEESAQGSQRYRDAISELNRKYGEYLPNLITEKTALDDVKRAAEGAAEAIRKKARANAYEKEMQVIQERFGTKLMDRQSDVAEALTKVDSSFGGDVAEQFIINFQTALEKEGGLDNIRATFAKTAKDFFGEDRLTAIVNKNASAWSDFTDAAEQYANVAAKVIGKQSILEKKMGVFEGPSYNSLAEKEQLNEINTWYQKQLSIHDDSLKKQVLSTEEYNKKLEQLEKDKLQKYIDMYTELGRTDMAKKYQEDLNALNKLQEGWKGVVNSALEAMGLSKNTSFSLWTDDYTQSVEFVDKLLERYKELDTQISKISSFDEEQVKNLEKNKAAIEAVAKALNLDLAALLEGKKKQAGKSPQEIEIETQIDLVKKLQDTYEELKDYLTDNQLRDILKALFPDVKEEWLKSFDFSSILIGLAGELDAWNKEAADKLRASVGKSVGGTIAQELKDIVAFKKMLDSWTGEDFNVSGKGVDLDISKVLSDLNNKYDDIFQKKRNALDLLLRAETGDAEAIALLKATLGEEYWEDYLKKGKETIEKLAQAEADAAKATADEKLRDLANKYVTELLQEKNIDLTDFGDKSLSQIKTLIKRLTEEKDAVEEEVKKIEQKVIDGTATEKETAKLLTLVEVLKLLGVKIADTGEEFEKSLIEEAQNSLSSISDLADEIANLGSEMENTHLEQFANGLKKTADLASEMLPKMKELSDTLLEIEDAKEKNKTLNDDEKIDISGLVESAKGGAAGIIAGIVGYLYSSISEIITSATERQRLLNDATSEYRDILFDIRRESHTSIFGIDELALAAENMKILSEANNEYLDILSKIDDRKFQKNGKGGAFYSNTSVREILEDISKSQGWDLYLANGELNIAALEAYYDAYSDRLSRKQRNLVSQLIDAGNAYQDAATQQAEYLTSIFSKAADTIADGMVAAFIESGEAAYDMRDVVSNVASTMASDLIKSLYIMPILTDYAEDLKRITEDESLTADQKTELALSIFQQAVNEIEGNKDAINATLEKLDEYFAHPEDEQETSLSQGIKGITEDQANLLASYLNAIRADVAFSKTLWVRMDANLQRIADMFTSSPTLMEYQAQIAANTYNTATYTQAILARLSSVIGIGNDGEGVRVIS